LSSACWRAKRVPSPSPIELSNSIRILLWEDWSSVSGNLEKKQKQLAISFPLCVTFYFLEFTTTTNGEKTHGNVDLEELLAIFMTFLFWFWHSTTE
jgi:hypothetical protein